MYIVLEVQSNGETASTLAMAYTSMNEAQNKYHTILASAAVSNVPKHSAFILTEEGVIENSMFEHETN